MRTVKSEVISCVRIYCFNGHMRHPFNHFLGHQVIVMDVSFLLINIVVIDHAKIRIIDL